ncbi:MAG: peptidylprolyl isomerase [Bacteroidales bacterium]|nr:peptidylprolyl isomerase [Bacteroidales bacterium]
MKRLFVLFVLIFLSALAFAQKEDDVVLEIQGEKISATEFMKMYNRNNAFRSSVLDKEDLKNYLDLYINYKLKLLQAKEEGLDTTKAFKEEVETYRKQMTQPYINDVSITDSLVEEAFDREKDFLRASHILISIPANATPADTLAAYKKAMMIREKALRGEDFSSLAVEYSDDLSAKDREATEEQKEMRGNSGDLGYFTSMTMVYPFESACYSLKKGEISMPVRTNFGYHIIKLTDRIPALFFTCHIKHVWINSQNHSEQEGQRLIEEAYSLVDDWKIDSVARKYSEDTYSSKNNGWLMNQKPNTMPAEYIEYMKTMKEGDLSPIIKTRFGWHFFKLMNINPLQNLEQRKPQILQRISRDTRGYKTVESFIENSKNYYAYKENKKNLEDLYPLITDSIFSANWQIPSEFTGDKILFSLGDTTFTQMDFLEELYVVQKRQTPEYIPTFVDKMYKNISDSKVLQYADSKLEERYPELKETMDAFREGILIYTITDKEVWNRSLIDTVGIAEFYELHKSEYNWQERAEATMWSIDKGIDLKKANKLILKNAKKNKTDDETRTALLQKFSVTDKPDKYFSYSAGRYEKGANRNVDDLIWNTSVSANLGVKNVSVIDTSITTNRNNILVLKKFLPPQSKTLEECRGIVTSQYQDVLEKNWIERLRSKYDYKVNYNVFNSIAK